MRVGLVIYGSLDTLSGGYLYDRRLVAYLRGCGDTVQIVSMPWVNYPAHLVQNFDPALLRQMSGLNVDVLLQDELNHPSLAWTNARLKEKVTYPILSIVHHLRASEQHPAGFSALYRLLERRFLASLDGFIFNSQTTRGVVEGILGRTAAGVVATPGGDQLGAGLDEAAIRARAGLVGPVRVLFVGNLIARKGLETLIAALARLPQLDWQLRVVGRRDVEPVYAARMEHLAVELGIAQRVVFLGRMENDALRTEFSTAHLLAVPSQYEGFGIVYLEGMAHGLPAVATTGGAAVEIVRDGLNGLLVNPGDAGALASRLEPLMADRASLLAMSLAARARFEQFPSWDASMAGIRQYLLTWLR